VCISVKHYVDTIAAHESYVNILKFRHIPKSEQYYTIRCSTEYYRLLPKMKLFFDIVCYLNDKNSTTHQLVKQLWCKWTNSQSPKTNAHLRHTCSDGWMCST